MNHPFLARRIIATMTLGLLLSIVGLSIGADPPKVFEKTGEDYSSDFDTTVVRVFRDKASAWGTMQFRVYYEQGVYISEKDKARASKNGQVIWEGDNRAWALVSVDGEGIIVDHHVNSDLGELLVFRLQADGSYKKVDVDFQKEALQLLAAQEKAKKPPAFDRIFCYGNEWLNDHMLLGHLQIRSGNSLRDPLWFIFDCQTRRFSFDLRDLNKGTYRTIQLESGK